MFVRRVSRGPLLSSCPSTDEEEEETYGTSARAAVSIRASGGTSMTLLYGTPVCILLCNRMSRGTLSASRQDVVIRNISQHFVVFNRMSIGSLSASRQMSLYGTAVSILLCATGCHEVLSVSVSHQDVVIRNISQHFVCATGYQ